VIFNNNNRSSYGFDANSAAPMFGREMMGTEIGELINAVEVLEPFFSGRLIPQGTSDTNGGKYRGIMGTSGGSISSAHHVAQHPTWYCSCYILAGIGIHFYGSSNVVCINMANSDQTYWDSQTAISDGVPPNAIGPGPLFLANASAIASAGTVFHVQTSNGEPAQGQATAFANALTGLGIAYDGLDVIPFAWHTSWAYATQPLPWHYSKFKLNPTCNGPSGLTTSINTPLVVSSSTMTANDTDPQNLALHVSAVSSPSHGTVSVSGGTVTFTPTTGYTGPASFNYTATNSDTPGLSGSGVANLTVVSGTSTTPFITYGFQATVVTGTAAFRDTPDRLNDVINVKDFGAVGDGVTDDSAAIQRAINNAYTISDTLTGGGDIFMGGRVFFPVGTYWVGGTTIHLINPSGTGGNRAIQMVGVGKSLSIIKGLNNTAHIIEAVGYIDSIELMQHLTVWNTSTTANTRAVWMVGGQANEGRWDNCKFIGMVGVDYDNNAFPATFSNCDFVCSAPIGTANSASPGPVVGTVGLAIGQWSIYNCSFTGFDIGCVMETGGGGNVTGCRAYRCNIGFNPGGFHGTGGGLQAGGLTGCLAERCRIGIHNDQSQGATHAGNVIKGQIGTDIHTAVSPSSGPAEPAAIGSTSWSAGTVTVNTSVPHNLAAGTQKLSLSFVNSAWLPSGNTDGLVSCNNTGTSQFQFTGPGSSPGASTTGFWNYPMLHAITSLKTKGTLFAANYVDAPTSLPSVDMNPGGGGSFAYEACSVMAMNGAYGWSFPPGDNGGGPVNIYLLQIGGNFPTVNSGATGGVEEIIVSDGPAGLGFNALFTGSGSTQYKIRRTGANFAVVG
jgi:hypothetical protein